MSFSAQQLQSQLQQMLPLGDSEAENKTIKTEWLKIVDNTLVFDNTLYHVRNISSVTLADLTETHAINTRVPVWYWFLLVLGLVLLSVFIGFFILIYVGYLFWQHSKLTKERTVERYGLKMKMNSGEFMILTSGNKEFILKIILRIQNVLNSNEPKALTFNFDTYQIEDKSINIESSYGSAVVSGHVTGDLVNNLGI
jgi:Family of unknown function (DUF6232)